MNTKNSLKIIALAAPIVLILSVLAATRAAGFSPSAPMKLGTPVVAQGGDPSAEEPLILTDAQGQYPLGLHMEILEDPTGKLTIEEVSSPAFASQFTPSQVAVPNYGYTESAYWVRLHLDNETRQVDEWLLEVGFAHVHYVDLYTPLPDGKGFDVKQTGILRPISTRDVLYPNIIFNLSVPAQSQDTYYLRFKNGASMTIPLTLWTKDAFFSASGRVLMFHWFFFGGIIALLVYHLFLLITVKEVSYLYFVILLASLFVSVFDYTGYMGVFLFPDWFTFKLNYFPLSLVLVFASMILFSDAFLELKARLPKLHWANIILLTVWGVFALLIPFISYYKLARLVIPWGLVSMAVILVIGMISWRRGFRRARFFMFAWLAMGASFFLALLVRQGIAPSTFFSENSFLLGMLLMAVCWSLALADRINLLKAETESANRNLRNSEHKLTQILESLPLGVVVYGNDQKLKYLNKRTVEILKNPAKGIQPDLNAGRTLAQAGEYFSFQVAGTNEKYPTEAFPVYRALHGVPASADNIEANLGDKRVPLEVWASPIRDDAGNVESAIAVLQDITQRRQAEAELAEYQKSLEMLVKERTAELEEVNEQLQLRFAWLTAVNKIQPTIKGTAGLAVVFEELSAKIQQLLNARLVFILHWDDQREFPEIYFCTQPGGSSLDINIIKVSFQKNSPLYQEIGLGKIITWSADQTTLLPDTLEEWFFEHDIQLSILAPMIIGQSFFGVLGVAVSAPWQDFTLQQADLIERMGFDLASLAQDAVLRDQTLALVALDERNRLARDLHDSVTQVLFTAALLTEVLPQIWRRDPEQGFQTLDKLRRLTHGALAEMRTMLIELRPSAVINTPLSELLAQLTEAITSRSGLPFQLFIEQTPLLPEEVQMNFYRIAQEALNNVVKHAQALHVTVSLSETPLPVDVNGVPGRQVKLVIQDDGVGFYYGSEKPGHLGIGIMRERAAAIQATFSLESEPGHGTRVSLIWSSESKSGN